MLARLRKMQEENEEGFTLIELLVVIIIIGILAAIAIPVFLNQRQKGYDAGIKSDLDNAATAEETYLTDFNSYTTTVNNLTSEGFKYSNGSDYSGGSPTMTAEFVTPAGASGGTATQGYCLSATSASGAVWSYNSSLGGLQAKNVACP
jgi:type IV pilus assembly protein PilA